MNYNISLKYVCDKTYLFSENHEKLFFFNLWPMELNGEEFQNLKAVFVGKWLFHLKNEDLLKKTVI